MTQKKLREKSGFLPRLFARFASNKSERRRRDPTKSRTLRVESLESREVLSVAGWISPPVAPTSAAPEIVSAAPALGGAEYSLVEAPSAPTLEDATREVESLELSADDPSVFESFSDEELAPAFYADGTAYYDVEQLRLHKLDLSGGGSASSSNGDARSERMGLRSGGGTDPIRYEVGLSSTLLAIPTRRTIAPMRR